MAFKDLSASDRWAALVTADRRAVQIQGYQLVRVPGRGLANIWRLKRGGKELRAAFRTTQDRFIAFPPMDGHKVWKTLDEVDVVVIATVDQKDDPQKVSVYWFDRDEVRTRFVEAHKARVKGGIPPKDNFGMWVNGDPDHRPLPGSVGSGLFALRPPIAVYDVQELLKPDTADASAGESIGSTAVSSLGGTTIADVLKAARERIAQLAGVPVESVRLDLKLEM